MISSAQTGGVASKAGRNAFIVGSEDRKIFSVVFFEGDAFYEYTRGSPAKQISVSACFTLAQQPWFRLKSEDEPDQSMRIS